MSDRRSVEIFSAGCPVCEELVERVQEEACPECEVMVHDVSAATGLARARELGVGSVPAVAIDGVLAECCARRGPDLASLRAAGLGRPS